MFSPCMQKRRGAFLGYILSGNVSNLRISGGMLLKLNSERPLKRVSCPIPAVRLRSFGIVVWEEKERRVLTVFRTL